MARAALRLRATPPTSITQRYGAAVVPPAQGRAGAM